MLSTGFLIESDLECASSAWGEREVSVIEARGSYCTSVWSPMVKVVMQILIVNGGN